MAVSAIGKPGRPLAAERAASINLNRILSEKYSTGDFTYQQLAALYGLHYTSISRRIYAHRKRQC